MDDIFTPNCRQCLLPMIPVTSGETVDWWCDECTPQRPSGLRLAADTPDHVDGSAASPRGE